MRAILEKNKEQSILEILQAIEMETFKLTEIDQKKFYLSNKIAKKCGESVVTKAKDSIKHNIAKTDWVRKVLGIEISGERMTLEELFPKQTPEFKTKLEEYQGEEKKFKLTEKTTPFQIQKHYETLENIKKDLRTLVQNSYKEEYKGKKNIYLQ